MEEPMDRAISEFSAYNVTSSGQMLVLDTTTSTTKRILLSDFATYVLGSVQSIIEGGDHQTAFLSDQNMDGGNATTP